MKIRRAQRKIIPNVRYDPPPLIIYAVTAERKMPGPHITSAISFLFKKTATTKPIVMYTRRVKAINKKYVSIYYASQKYILYATKAVNVESTTPHNMSTKTSCIGQFFTVARLVRSYVI